MKIRVAGAGCCLMDLIYPEVDFSSAAFRAAASGNEGDGALAPGRLVFAADAEAFAGRPFAEVLADIVGRAPDGGPASPAAENVGGPSVVSLVHAAQMLEGEGAASLLPRRGGGRRGRPRAPSPALPDAPRLRGPRDASRTDSLDLRPLGPALGLREGRALLRQRHRGRRPLRPGRLRRPLLRRGARRVGRHRPRAPSP